jgi:hypothetical protein
MLRWIDTLTKPETQSQQQKTICLPE